MPESPAWPRWGAQLEHLYETVERARLEEMQLWYPHVRALAWPGRRDPGWRQHGPVLTMLRPRRANLTARRRIGGHLSGRRLSSGSEYDTRAQLGHGTGMRSSAHSTARAPSCSTPPRMWPPTWPLSDAPKCACRTTEARAGQRLSMLELAKVARHTKSVHHVKKTTDQVWAKSLPKSPTYMVQATALALGCYVLLLE